MQIHQIKDALENNVPRRSHSQIESAEVIISLLAHAQETFRKAVRIRVWPVAIEPLEIFNGEVVFHAERLVIRAFQQSRLVILGWVPEKACQFRYQEGLDLGIAFAQCEPFVVYGGC